MDTSQNASSQPFKSEEWGSFIVLRETNRIWFGFVWQRDAAFICFFFAFAFALGGVGIFLEGEGLKANLADAITCVTGTTVFIAALAMALIGKRLLRSANRVGMLDLENGCFFAVDQKSGKTKKAFPCEDLYIRLWEEPPADGDAGFHGKISIVGPEEPDSEESRSEVDVTIFHYLPYEDFFKAVRELEQAASWKDIIGDEVWVNMHRSRQ